MNLIASGMLILAGAIVAQIGVVIVASSPHFALARASVIGVLDHVTREQVSDAITGRALGNFFSADLDLVKQLVEEIPWVRNADVRRQWPDRLEILVEEHRVLARWGDQKLINVHGELFVALARANLPMLNGPAGSEAEMARRYYRFRELVKPLDAEPVELLMSPRYAWTLKLSNGMTIELGREQAKSLVDTRLQRFVDAHGAATGALGRKVMHADLRYPNGFAVRIPGLGAEPPRAPIVKKKG
ncbi:MAG: cell division protein FtsQ/DivIB [Burkholderiales bacterium]